MEAFYTERFRRSYDSAPEAIRRATDRAITKLLADLRHPSLHTKKYDEARDVWQGRVNRAWRFYFKIEGHRYYLLDVTVHPK